MEIKQLYNHFLTSKGVCIDTRTLKEDELFFAISGPNFDGNAYADEALKKGAYRVVIDNPSYYKDDSTILVKNSITALQELASYHRMQFDIPVLGITGSNGKTTTKELIREVLSHNFKVLATKGNLNNHLGVPLTLLEINAETEIAIIEMGANHIGEIRLLSEITNPSHGLITNIGKAHLEGFGSIEGVRKGKGELYDHLRTVDGIAFVNRENGILMGMLKGMTKLVTYGTAEEVDCRGKIESILPYLKISILGKGQACEISSNLTGSYNLENILSAVCIGQYFNVPIAKIKVAIEDYHPNMNRSQLIKKDTNTYIMDAYNANPSSMNAALSNFSMLKAAQKLIILGDMMELGDHAKEEHLQVLKAASSLQSTRIILIGEYFKEANLHENVAEKVFVKTDELKEWFSEQKLSNYSILVKGSRKMQLETILD